MLHYKDYKEYAHMLADNGKSVIEKVTENNRLSFTPYIYNACSANCAFCSEKLIRDGQVMVCDGLCDDYVERLKHVFSRLHDRPVFLSLSGKEPSESVDVLEMIMKEAKTFIENGGIITEKVMYSNLSGFCKEKEQLKKVLLEGGVNRIECSRHHYDEEKNQAIVNFKEGETIKSNAVFQALVKELNRMVPMKMVCVLQRQGIATAEDILRYLEFAQQTGVCEVVFRELAMFDDAVDQCMTSKYIVENRVELKEILEQLDPAIFRELHIVEGYYYFSFQYKYQDMHVSFEMSDYEEMIRKHYGDELHKLILYPNGMLCKDWNMKGEIPLYEK